MCVPQTDGMLAALVLRVARARCTCDIRIVSKSAAPVFRVGACDGINQKTWGVRRRRVDFAPCFRLIPAALSMAVHVLKHALSEQHIARFVWRKEGTATHTNG